MDGVCLAEFLTSDVCELSFGDEGLGFCAYEFLFEGDDFGGGWFFVFQFCEFVGDLDYAVRISVQSKTWKVVGGQTFALWSLDGCTLVSVFLICFRTLLYSSKPWAKTSSCSPISASKTPILSEISDTASSPVLSPHSLSCCANPTRSRPAVS